MVPEGWKLRTISDVGEVITGNTPKTADRTLYDGPIPFVSPADLGTGRPLTSSTKTLTEKGFATTRKVRKGATLFTCIGSTIGKIGLAGVDLATNQQINSVVPNNSHDDFFIYYALALRARHIATLAGKQAVPIINKSMFADQPILTPPLPEQKKIAQILSTWDQAITATERLLENSQKRKKGLMQQLLTGKKRLVASDAQLTRKKTRTGYIPGDWEYPKIAEICSQITDKNTEDHQYPVLACSKHYGFVDSLSYFKKRVYSEDLTGYRVIPRGCIGFPANHVEEGSIGLQNLYDFGLVSPIYVVARPNPKKINADYLYAVLKTDHYRQIFSAATNASVDRRGSLRWKEFSQIRIPLPPLAEQNKIAEFLELATKGINALEVDLKLLKQEKKALMQQLLTGKRRVQVDTEAA